MFNALMKTALDSSADEKTRLVALSTLGLWIDNEFAPVGNDIQPTDWSDSLLAMTRQLPNSGKIGYFSDAIQRNVEHALGITTVPNDVEYDGMFTHPRRYYVKILGYDPESDQLVAA